MTDTVSPFIDAIAMAQVELDALDASGLDRSDCDRDRKRHDGIEDTLVSRVWETRLAGCMAPASTAASAHFQIGVVIGLAEAHLSDGELSCYQSEVRSALYSIRDFLEREHGLERHRWFKLIGGHLDAPFVDTETKAAA